MNNGLPYVRVFEAHELDNLTVDGCALFKVLLPGDKRRPEVEIDPGAALVLVELLSGEWSLSVYNEHEEGYERRWERVCRVDAEDGRPAGWHILDKTTSRDCDGLTARTWTGWSLGGDPRGRWMSDSNQTGESYFDGAAQAAGY